MNTRNGRRTIGAVAIACLFWMACFQLPAASAPREALGIVPPPPGCDFSGSGVGTGEVFVIPDGGTLTTTLTVGSAGPYLLDIDLRTDITHPTPQDLDITLTSPAGTVVTITTDNGSGVANAFDGTVWDDDAGAVNPPGPVTDAVFAPSTVESPLVPEEAMGAFVGENPNGAWTLTITDDSDRGGRRPARGGGTLDGWALNLTSLAAAPTETTVTAANLTPLPISDGATVTSTISVAGAGGYMLDVDLTTFVVNAFPDDLVVTLTSPAGTVVTITSNNGGESNDPFNGTVWDDDAGDVNPPGPVTDAVFDETMTETPLVPEEAMGAFIGENPNGTWTIAVTDEPGSPTAGPMLTSWSLAITTAECPGSGACMLDCPNGGNISATSPDGVVYDYPLPTTTGTCGPVTCTPPPGSLFPIGTTTVTCSDSTGAATCSFDLTAVVQFDSCCVDDFTGDTFSTVVASVPSSSPLYGYWQYDVTATGESFMGTSSFVAYRPGLSLVMRDNDDPTYAMYVQIDYPRKKCLVQTTDRSTVRQFTLRDRDITDNSCATTH